MTSEVSLVPMREGPEITLIEGAEGIGYDDPCTTFTAFSGTGFDSHSPQHRFGSSALRFAIAIQQKRDDLAYQEADAMCDLVKRFGYDVGKAKDRTVLKVATNRKIWVRGVPFLPRSDM